MIHSLSVVLMQVVSRLVHLLGTRILGTLKGEPAPMSAMSAATAPQTPKVTNLSTVAIIAISDDVPIVAFGKELEKHLALIGRCCHQRYIRLYLS